MAHGTSLPRAKRSDAERNREKIVAAARSAFADPEAEISMAEISRRAGVGMATLYRNFPGRRELLEALFIDEVDAVCQAAETIEADTPGAVLEAWLHRFFGFYNSKRHVGSELLKHADNDPTPFFSQGRDRVLAAGRPLLEAAQRSDEARDDLTLEQILDMVIGIATIHGDPAYLKPILQTALNGLHPAAAGRPTANRRAGEAPAAKSPRTSRGRRAGSRASGRRANAPDAAVKRPRQ